MTLQIINKDLMPTFPLPGFGDLDVHDIFFLILMLFTILFKKKRVSLPKFIKKISWIFFAWLFFSLVQGYYFHGNTLNNGMRELTMLLNYFLFVPVFFLADTEKKQKLFLGVILTFGVVIAGIGIMGFFTGDEIMLGGHAIAEMNIASWEGLPRLQRILGFGFVNFAFLYAALYILQRKSIVNIKVLAYLFISTFAIAITFGRTNILALFISLIIGAFLLFRREDIKHKLYTAEILLVFLLIIALFIKFLARVWVGEDFISALFERGSLFFEEIEDGSGNWGGRLVEQEYILGHIRQNPLIGKGLGYIFIIGFFGQFFSHNGFLEMIGKMGIIGLILFVMFYGSFMKYGLELIWDKKKEISQRDALLVTTCMSYLVFVLIKSLAANMFFYYTEVVLIGIIFSLLLTFRNKTLIAVQSKKDKEA